MDKLKKIDKTLNAIMASSVGVFIGHSLFRYFHYKKVPGLYEIQSAPWYTSILVYAIAISIIILLAIILKLLIKKKLKTKKS